jgi:hypothetical protein
MTRAVFIARGAPQSARALRSLLQELFTLSLRQMELLEQENYAALEDLLERKSALLQMLPPVVAAARERGWKLNDPSTFPADETCARLMREAADFSVRLQAHEKYCLGEMIARRSRIGERLAVLSCKRNAASGYRAALTRGRTVDASR